MLAKKQQQPPYIIPPEEWPDVLRRVKEEESYSSIARSYNTYNDTVARIIQKMLKRGDIPADDPVIIPLLAEKHQPPRRAIPLEEWPNVLRRAEAGESYESIAQSYNTTRHAVRRTIRKMRKQQSGSEA